MNIKRFGVIALLCTLFCFSAQADTTEPRQGIPVWTFTPLTPTTLSLGPTDFGLVIYRVTNQSRRVHRLVPRAIPNTYHFSLLPGHCSATNPIGYHESCLLTLGIRGSNATTDILGGPALCELGNPQECYQPSAANILNVSFTGKGLFTITP